MPYTILLIEDDFLLRESVTDYLESKSLGEFQIISADNGISGMQEILNERYDIILLDIMLPGKDGFALCETLRKRSNVPVMFLTARAMEEDKLTGYALGCDDYLVKPFSLAELFVRIKALLRRANGTMSEILTCGNIVLNTKTGILTANDTLLELPRREYQLLTFLLGHKNQVLSRDQLLSEVWGHDFDGLDRVVDNHIKKLRKHLGRDAACIRTVIGIGYKLEDPS